jgi:fumarate reductase subunit D
VICGENLGLVFKVANTRLECILEALKTPILLLIADLLLPLGILLLRQRLLNRIVIMQIHKPISRQDQVAASLDKTIAAIRINSFKFI